MSLRLPLPQPSIPRHALAVALSLGVGCADVFDIEEVRSDNAVLCECSCDAGGGPRNVLIARAEDDVEEVGGSMDLGSGDLDLGVGFVGLRFESLTIPQGASIDHAYVQFTGDADGETDAASFVIRIQDSTAAAAFTSTDDDLGGRLLRADQVAWSPGAWNDSASTPDQRTPDLATLLQPLVNDASWNDASAIVLRFEGTSGHRSAESFEGSDQQALLIVELSSTVAATLPVCASDQFGSFLEQSETQAQCDLVADTLGSMASLCGYPQPCSCSVVDAKDPSGVDRPDAFPSSICEEPCDSVAVDGTCSNFDPNAFSACLANGSSLATCKAHVGASVGVDGDEPICVASGSPLAFHAFGERSECVVGGISDILVDGTAPKNDPATAGRIEILGEPCTGGGCRVHPYFGLQMDDISFEVRFAKDPVFGDLVADGTALQTAPTDANGDALFGTDTVLATGAGRRGGDGVQISDTNPNAIGLQVDWAGATCLMDGGLELPVGDDGVCENDATIACVNDADCTAVGGACDLPDETVLMEVGLALEGNLVNQPPRANAGADQTVECTSTAGATFALDGRGSSDPDHNLALASWRQGSRTGTLLANDLVVSQTLGVGGSGSYVLRLVDGFAQTDEDTTSVSVVDTTPPDIACNAPPTVLPPHAEPGIAFVATATDTCDAEVAAVVTGYDCFTFTKKGRRVSKLESCIVSIAGDTLTVHDVGGYGDVIQWTVAATDDSGNVGEQTCEVVVSK